MPRHLTELDFNAGGALAGYSSIQPQIDALNASLAALGVGQSVEFAAVSAQAFNVEDGSAFSWGTFAPPSSGFTDGIVGRYGVTFRNALLQNALSIGAYTATSDVAGLVPGSTFGGLIESAYNAHLVVGIRENDVNDSFAVVSGSGNWITDQVYDLLLFQVRADGRVIAPVSLSVGGGAQITKLDEGFFSPTATNTTNITASTTNLQTAWTRTNDEVTVIGQGTVLATATGALTTLKLSLPVPSTLGGATRLSGVGTILVGLTSAPIRIIGDSVNNLAQLDWISPTTSNATFTFMFVYRVL